MNFRLSYFVFSGIIDLTYKSEFKTIVKKYKLEFGYSERLSEEDKFIFLKEENNVRRRNKGA